MENTDQKMSLLKKVVMAATDFTDAIKELEKQSWDHNGPTVLLERAVIRDVLFRYASGEINAQEVFKWADFLELREDVDFDEKDESLLSDIMHELANPDLEGKLDVPRAKFLMEKLRS